MTAEKENKQNPFPENVILSLLSQVKELKERGIRINDFMLSHMLDTRLVSLARAEHFLTGIDMGQCQPDSFFSPSPLLYGNGEHIEVLDVNNERLLCFVDRRGKRMQSMTRLLMATKVSSFYTLDVYSEIMPITYNEGGINCKETEMSRATAILCFLNEKGRGHRIIGKLPIPEAGLSHGPRYNGSRVRVRIPTTFS